MLQKIIFGILLGLGITGWLIQDDTWIKKNVHDYLQQRLEMTGNCHVSFQVDSINFFLPRIVLKDVIVTPQEGTAWQWRTSRVTISSSWLHFIRFGFLHAHVDAQDFYLTTLHHQGQLACADHFNALYASPASGICIFIKEFLCKNSHVRLVDDITHNEVALQLHIAGKKVATALAVHAHVHDGSLQFQNMPSIKSIQGLVNAEFITCEGRIVANLQTNLSGKCMRFELDSPRCLLEGSWEQDHGCFTLKTAQGVSLLGPIRITQSEQGYSGSVEIAMNLNEVYRLVAQKACGIEGKISGHLELDYHKQELSCSGAISLKDITYKGVRLCSDMTTLVSKKGLQWEGSLKVYSDGLAAQGSWFWHQNTKVGALETRNTSDIVIPGAWHWKIKPYGGSVLFSYNQSDERVNIAYKAQITHDILNEKKMVEGTVSIDSTSFNLKGTLNNSYYSAQGMHSPEFFITKAHILDHDKKTLLDVKQGSSPALLMGKVHMPLLQTLLLTQWGYDVQGEGVFDSTLTMQDTPILNLHLDKGTIRLPGTYNFINAFQGTFALDFQRREGKAYNVRCGLHKGTIVCQQANLLYDAHYNPTFIHAPITLSKCLLNVSKDLYAIVSGRVLLSKQEDELPLIKSSLIIEQAQFKENIFSADFQQNLFAATSSPFMVPTNEIACDITLETKSPIFIKTPFLETRAHIALHAQKTIQSPDIMGTILLRSGSINFPYKPLFITQGILYVNPQQEPMIKLVAKNTIKKHMITLTIDGQITNPHIMLESSPPLTEEQIIALLLAGSTHESLNVVMPAMIMKNITGLLFGKEQSSAKLEHYFKTLLKPFKRIHIVPSFTDQKGRGGLRGAVEIDVNERWRVLAQKNFSLSEDTRLEVEYAISDDIGIRGFRDERRDIGAEVEMKWKF